MRQNERHKRNYVIGALLLLVMLIARSQMQVLGNVNFLVLSCKSKNFKTIILR